MGTVGEDVETTGKSERRLTDEGTVRPDDLGALPPDPLAEAADSEGTELCEAESSCVADAVGEADDADGDPECAAPDASAGEAELRGMARLRTDSDWLRVAWRTHSLSRTILMVVCLYALTVGPAYFLMVKPLGKRLHEVMDQKSIMLDYIVIQQASAAIDGFKHGLMTGDRRLTVMSEVRLMAEGSGVKIVGDPDLLLGRHGSGQCAEYPVRLRVRGSFHDIGAFLSLVESSPRFIVVEEIDVRSDAASKDRESEATVLLAIAAWEE